MKLNRPLVSLKATLALLLALATLMTFLVVGTGILLVRLPQVQERAQEQAEQAAEATSALLERMLQGVEQQLAPAAVLAPGMPVARLQPYLEALVRQSGDFDAVLLLDGSGLVSAAVLSGGSSAANAASTLSGQDLSGNPLFRRIREHQKGSAGRDPGPVWSDSYISPVTGEVTVGVALSAGAQVLIGEVALPRLLRLVQTLERPEVNLMVIDQRGHWLASNMSEGRRFDYTNFEAFQELAQGLRVARAVKVLEEDWWVGGQVSERLSWLIVGGVPAGMANYSYRTTVLLVIMGFFGSMVLVLSLAPLWASRLSRPFLQLAQRARRVADGDYQPLAARVLPIREFRALEQDLDSMARAIQARESAVRRSEQQLMAVLEYTPSVAIQWYDRDGRVVYWNPASTEIYGFAVHEALGRSILDDPLIYLDQSQARDFVDVLAEIERTGRSVGPVEFGLRHKDGHIVTVLATTFAIPGDEGQPIFVCMDVDISSQKLAQRALQEQEAKLEAIFNASPAPMSVSNVREDYAILSVNRAWEDLFGRRREEVLGQNGAGIGFWVEATDRQRFVAELQRSGQVQNFEAWCLAGQGRTILCQFSALITDIGSERLLLMMTVDITEQRRIEQELQALNNELESRVDQRTEELARSKQALELSLLNLQRAQDQLVESEKLAALGQLVAGVAHELNTPMGNGLMAVTTIGDRLKDFRTLAERGLRRSELESFLQYVQQSTDIAASNLLRSAELVRSFKQVAVDQTSSQRRSFELGEVVREVVTMLEPTIRLTPYRVELNVTEGLQLDSFPGPVGQVLGNLINNALIHAFDGRLVGTITVEAAALDAQQLRMVVRDDGCGIDPSLRRRVFEPFFTTRMGRGGTGLGLHIAYNIVTHLLGGSIDLEGQPGRGSAFVIVLPYRAPEQPTRSDATAMAVGAPLTR
jgi:PAS domain S-box-containing protein